MPEPYPRWAGDYYQAPYNPHVYVPPAYYNHPYYAPQPHVQPQPQPQPQPHNWQAFLDRQRSSKYPHLNPALAADMTHVRYDLRKAPASGMLFSTYQQVAQTPALDRPTLELRVVSKAFPWTIDIKVAAPAVVMCGAVWDAMYKMLQEPIADSEWGLAIHDKTHREAIEKAAKARQDAAKGADGEKKLKRIDWLGEATVFKGLERDEEFEKRRLLPGTAAVAETWVVKFGKP
ncbi:hypothetical protein BJ138DRAFT_1094455 [Hygrophoropsis aurantiaca]|uniref:Uncharacterized protein n=1 Tax=Hygrophoropsis aurantiaca TaxID=72124 RepID=A0ACB7ZYZ4_9AGAM|nr:hypothetical protein BJ138DRAFT_1094455 [Hygrophoropsis aurantiaca]